METRLSPQPHQQPSLEWSAALEMVKTSVRFQKKVISILKHEQFQAEKLQECGTAPLAILKDRPEEVLALAHEKLHSFPYKDVPECWMRLYTEACLWKIGDFNFKADDDEWLLRMVKELDMALILTGGLGRYDQIQELFEWMQYELYARDDWGHYPSTGQLAPYLPYKSQAGRKKRPKIERDVPSSFPGASAFSSAKYAPKHDLLHPLERFDFLSLPAFQQEVLRQVRPFIISHGAQWAAHYISESAWANVENLLRFTLGGRRLVPVELGRSYTDENWGQKIMTFSEFLLDYMMQDPSLPESERKIGYLAQHDLFHQMPHFRDEIQIPDYCYADIPEQATGARDEALRAKPPAAMRDHFPGNDDGTIMLNAWFGPAHTISPLHTDPHHNILAQVVGFKYVRLYAPDQTQYLYARNKEGEVDMSNTSQIDVDFVMKAFEGRSFEPGGACDVDGDREQLFLEQYPEFAKARYVEGILSPEDCLFIPRGWWHYVRSLTPSCSVSFWWD